MAKSLYVSTSVLFDIDENQDSIVAQQRRQQHQLKQTPRGHHDLDTVIERKPTRRVSIQGVDVVATPTVDNGQDDPVLGDDELRYHGQSSTTNNMNRQRFQSAAGRTRARSRRQSVAPWPICGLVMPVVLLRTLTALVVIPLVVAGLVWLPRVAVVWLSVLLVCMCAYEYSWLAFRIHYQLLSTYSWYERAPSEVNVYGANDEHAQRLHFQSFASGVVSIKSQPSMSHRHPDSICNEDDDDEEDHTIGGEGGLAAQVINTAVSPLETLEFLGASSAVSSIAESWCGGHEWLAKLVLSAAFTAAWVTAMHFALPATSFPVALQEMPSVVVFDVAQLTWLANFIACLGALSSPNMRFAASMLLQVTVFLGILVNSLSCPIMAARACEQPLLSGSELFAMGALLVIMLRALTSTSPADMIIVTMVDLVGYLFIVGNFSLLVGVVDIHQDHEYLFARVVLLLVVVLWTAQVAGYACDRLISHFQLSRYRILPRRIAVRLDLESSVCASCMGVLAMALGSWLVALPTPLWINAIVAFVGVVLARLGRLFFGLLKRAAGLRRTSRTLPGFGGVLDMASSLLLAAVVFAKLYVIVSAQIALEHARATAEERHDEVAALSVGFGNLDLDG